MFHVISLAMKFSRLLHTREFLRKTLQTDFSVFAVLKMFVNQQTTYRQRQARTYKNRQGQSKDRQLTCKKHVNTGKQRKDGQPNRKNNQKQAKFAQGVTVQTINKNNCAVTVYFSNRLFSAFTVNLVCATKASLFLHKQKASGILQILCVFVPKRENFTTKGIFPLLCLQIGIAMAFWRGGWLSFR